jgi:competence protein ComEC
MTLGDASALSKSAKNDFRRSSLTHIVAASGQNVSLLVVFVGLLCGLVGLDRRQRLVISGAAIVAYIPLAGGEAPIRRAAVMGLCALVSGAGAQRRAVLHSLLLAAAVTVLVDPNSLHSLSWQLSFAAVVGMMLLGEPITERLTAIGLNRLIAEALGATVAATIFTAPLIASAVGRYSLTAIPANILVAGVVGPVMFLGFAAALVGQLSVQLATPLVAAAALPVAYILEVAKLFARPSWAVRQWRPDLLSLVLSTAVPTLLILSMRPRRAAT